MECINIERYFEMYVDGKIIIILEKVKDGFLKYISIGI